MIIYPHSLAYQTAPLLTVKDVVCCMQDEPLLARLVRQALNASKPTVLEVLKVKDVEL